MLVFCSCLGFGSACLPEIPEIDNTRSELKEPDPQVTVTHESRLLVQRWVRAMGEEANLVAPKILVRDDSLAVHSLIQGKSEAVFLPRPPTGSEQAMSLGNDLIKGPPLVSHHLYAQPVTFLVHEDNPVETMTVGQLQLVLDGQTTLWLDVGGGEGEIAMYSLGSNNPVRKAAEVDLIGGKSLPSTVQTLPSAVAVAKAISNDPMALGIGTTETVPRVRMLGLQTDRMEVLLPFFAGKRGRDWPVLTILRGVTRGPVSPVVKSLLDFAASDRGREIAFEAVYLPLADSADEREAVPKTGSR